VICSDKTGTLTTNMMSVSRVAVVDGSAANSTLVYEVTGSTYSPEGGLLEPADGGGGERCPMARPADSPPLLQLAQCASMCNDSNVQYNQEKNVYEKIGEASEVALRVLVEKVRACINCVESILRVNSYLSIPHMKHICLLDIPVEGLRLAGWCWVFRWMGCDWPDGVGYSGYGMLLAGWCRVFPWTGCEWLDGVGYSHGGAAIGRMLSGISIDGLR
jgi:hypothetical protein